MKGEWHSLAQGRVVKSRRRSHTGGMSRAFTKEGGGEVPLVVPRAPLPDGVTNYVTPRGLAALQAERVALEASRPMESIEGTSGAAALAAYHARLGALDARIASAVVVDATTLPQDEVRFSATVTLRGEGGDIRRYRIVGVDEADAPSGRIAFVAPLSRQLMGKRVGDWVSLGQGKTELEIVGIDYAEEPARPG